MREDISNILNAISPDWALIHNSGKVIKTTLNDKNLRDATKILKFVRDDIDIGTGVRFRDLIGYRIKQNLFIFLVGKIDKEDLKRLDPINFEFEEEKVDYISIDIDLILFSMGLDQGPEPICHIPENYASDLVFKINIKSMLLFSVESCDSNKEMISFQPYMDLNSLGIIYLFQIEDENARGGAYNSSLTVLVNYNSRALLYENYAVIEKILNQAGKTLKKEYYSGKDYAHILKDLKTKLSNISIDTIEDDDLKLEMMKQVKKLANL